MSKIIFSLAMTAAAVMASVEVCQKGCGMDFGACLIAAGDFESCLKPKVSCSLDCFKGLQVKSNFKVEADVAKCQKRCAIANGRCLLTSFDMQGCTEQEAGCALDCLKSNGSQSGGNDC